VAGLAESGRGAVELAPAVGCTDYVGLPGVAPAAVEGACGDRVLWSADGEVAGCAERAVGVGCGEQVVGWVVEDLSDGGSRVFCLFWVFLVSAAHSSCLLACEHIVILLLVHAVLAIQVVSLVVGAAGMEWCRWAGLGWEVDRW